MASAMVAVWLMVSIQRATPRSAANSSARPLTAQIGGAAIGPHHFDVVPVDGTETDPERLHHRLLGGEANGEPLGGVRGRGRRRPVLRR